jgi:hypothetical protein
MIFTSDELFLALIGLLRATRPAMLCQEADGFSVDFEAIASSKTPGPADRLLLKIGALMQKPTEGVSENSKEAPADGSRALELDAAEAGQIADALAKLERLQAWPEDVMNMSRALRARLASEPGANSGEKGGAPERADS